MDTSRYFSDAISENTGQARSIEDCTEARTYWTRKDGVGMAILKSIPGRHCIKLNILLNKRKTKGKEKTLEMGELVMLTVLSGY